ncbi:MAG: hypothetical protein CBC94_001640 [Gammaproteobacteria bacterium TMED134]|nr:MAG: hypothetical protein CBC94_001640 [Gammaproteobacteria bacterium TMED134]
MEATENVEEAVAETGVDADKETATASEAPASAEASGDNEDKEDFAGFDGTWDYEWVRTLDQFMEDTPWTWIAVAVFAAGMIFSIYNNRSKSDD